MKTNLFNTNYSAPEMKVIEVELERSLLTDSGNKPGLLKGGMNEFGSINTEKSDDWSN